ncbi:hypothetical protein ONZ45_g9735 [Pleurotus djamor]|nr:hypothetical protein ONZ45_g9735 [Pleurotus djamor]
MSSLRQLLSFVFVLATLSAPSYGLRVPIKRAATSKAQAQQSQGSGLSRRATDISKNQHAAFMHNSKNNVYAVDIKIGGQDVTVNLDTGSADLWVKHPRIQTSDTTILTGRLAYAKGSVEGPIDYAPIETKDMEDIFDTGASGLMGLGFDATGSLIHNLTSTAFATSTDPSRTRSTISNIFYSNMSLPNFFTLLLGRTDDPDDEQAGVFTISEYIDEFAAVANSPKMNSQTDDHWSVLLDGVSVNGKEFPLTSRLEGVPSGKTIAVLDSGFSLPPVTPALVDAIYSPVPGAVNVEDIPELNAAGISYILPCNNPVADVSFKIGGIEFPIHPLDLTQVITDNKTVTVCINAYTKFNLDPTHFDGFDLILGDAFLRNSYTSFDYGSFNANGRITEAPFMQLLPTTKTDEARSEFAGVRAKQLQGIPKESTIDELKKLLSEEAQGDGSKKSGAEPLRFHPHAWVSLARELAEDAVEDMLRIAAFYDTNKDTLSSESLGPLCASLDALNRDLDRIHLRCQRYTHKAGNKFRRLAVGFELWRRSEEIEAELARLRNKIRKLLDWITLFICARNEVRLVRIEEKVLFAPHSPPTRLVPKSNDLILSFNAIDDVDVSYIRLKAMRVIQALPEQSLSASHFDFSEPPSYITTSNRDSFELSHYATTLWYLAKLCNETCHGQSSSSTAGFLHLALEATRAIGYFGCTDISITLCRALEKLIRRALVLTPIEQREGLESALAELLVDQARLFFIMRSSPEVTPEEAIKHGLEAVRVTRTRLARQKRPTRQHHVQLACASTPLITIYLTSGYFEECITQCLETVEIVSSLSSLSQETIDRFKANDLQLRAQVLFSLAIAQKSTCDYTSAYHTGMECVATIKALADFHASLPANFNSLHVLMDILERDLHTLTSIVRDPCRLGSYAEDEEYPEGDDNVFQVEVAGYIEWGIAF